MTNFSTSIPTDAWVEEPELVPESNFTPGAHPMWTSWNEWSVESQVADFMAALTEIIQPMNILETGVGQGYVTRRVYNAMPDGAQFAGVEYDEETYKALRPIIYQHYPKLGLLDPGLDRDQLFGDYIPDADFLILDSHWPERFPELLTWAQDGKPGSYCFVHDVDFDRRTQSGYHVLSRVIHDMELPAMHFGNPRGSTLLYKPEGYKLPTLYNRENIGKVALSFIFGAQVEGGFATSLALTCLDPNLPIATIISRQGGPMIHTLRNKVVEMFLTETDCDWLLQIDSDMAWSPEDLGTLLDVAHPKYRPIMGGLCFGRMGDGRLFPTMYQFKDGEFFIAQTVPTDRLINVDITGTAFLLVHRSVYEAMARKYEEPYRWFMFAQFGEKPMGEDFTFSMRARELGYPIMVHTGVEIGHIKQTMLDTDAYRKWKLDHKLIVTGTGRCGTAWVANFLNQLQVGIGHERIIHPGYLPPAPGVDMLPEGLRGESSWMAVPHLPRLRDQGADVVHLVREPMACISSLLNTGLFNDEVPEAFIEYAKWLRDYMPIPYDDPLLRTVYYYITWNEEIEKYAQFRMRIEDSHDLPTLDGLLEVASTKFEDDSKLKAISLADTPAGFNRMPDHRRTHNIDWKDIPDDELGAKLRAMAVRYGYLA